MVRDVSEQPTKIGRFNTVLEHKVEYCACKLEVMPMLWYILFENFHRIS